MVRFQLSKSALAKVFQIKLREPVRSFGGKFVRTVKSQVIALAQKPKQHWTIPEFTGNRQSFWVYSSYSLLILVTFIPFCTGGLNLNVRNLQRQRLSDSGHLPYRDRRGMFEPNYSDGAGWASAYIGAWSSRRTDCWQIVWLHFF